MKLLFDLCLLCFCLVVVVGFFVCALFFGVCCGFVFCVGLVFGFCLVVVVVVEGFSNIVVTFTQLVVDLKVKKHYQIRLFLQKKTR
jgi:hypothetical protein